MGDSAAYLRLTVVSSEEVTTTSLTLHLGAGEGKGWEQQKCFAKTKGFKMLHKNCLSYSEIEEFFFLEQAEIKRTQCDIQKWSCGCLSWFYQWPVWVWIILTMVIRSNSRCHCVKRWRIQVSGPDHLGSNPNSDTYGLCDLSNSVITFEMKNYWFHKGL